MINNKYLVKDNDPFDHDRFPGLQSELNALVNALAKVPTVNNKEMLLAFVRDHHIKLEWMNNNPELCELLQSGSIPTECLEALFDASIDNKAFQKQLETYIEARFAESTITY